MNKNVVLEIENAHLVFRNFSGKAGKYNNEGNRNFCVFLDSNIANELAKEGYNIKWLKPRDPDEPEQAYMQVKINFQNVPPKILLITSRNKTLLNEETINILDWAEIESVDLIINPYKWEVKGKVGIKPYVKSMYVKIVEDRFAEKYEDVPDSALSSLEEGD